MFHGYYADDREVFDIELRWEEYDKWSNRKKPYMKTSARFMYKSLARHWFEVTKVRCEHVQDISVDDIAAEGIALNNGIKNKIAFMVLWDSINKKRGYSWDKNNWVFAYTYKKIIK